MIEVKCNGKIYLFDESSEIIDHLDMAAQDVRDDPDDDPVPTPADAGALVHTHDTAALIVEKFEDLLDSKNIEITCSDPDEQAERHQDGNQASLYGTEYSELLDGVESHLVDMLEDFKRSGGQRYIRDVFSGNM